jgi:hypothetical protein
MTTKELFDKVVYTQKEAGRAPLTNAGTFDEWMEDGEECLRAMLEQRLEIEQAWLELFNGDTDSPNKD